jgi:hypothetical protein
VLCKTEIGGVYNRYVELTTELGGLYSRVGGEGPRAGGVRDGCSRMRVVGAVTAELEWLNAEKRGSHSIIVVRRGISQQC